MLGFIAVVIFLISKYFKGFDQRRVELNYFFPLLVRRAKKPCCCKDRNFQQFQPHMSAITIYSICPDFAQTWYRLSWTALSNVEELWRGFCFANTLYHLINPMCYIPEQQKVGIIDVKKFFQSGLKSAY